MTGLRPLPFLASAALLGAAAALSVADRGQLVLNSFVLRVQAATSFITVPLGFNRQHVPFEVNELAHLTGWAAITLALSVMLKRVPLGLIAVAAFFASASLEPMQALFSRTREFSFADIATNATGVLIGAAIAIAWRVATATWHQESLLERM